MPTKLSSRTDLVIDDPYPGIGPIRGVLAALEYATRDIFVLAGDLPAIDARTVRTITDQPADLAPVIDILVIDEALTRLASLSKRKVRLVECRCFAGMSVEESAEALGIARSTAVEDWAFARTWLSSKAENRRKDIAA